MTDLTRFLIVSLAVWRLTRLIQTDDGPFDVLHWFRFKMGVRYDADNHPYGMTVISKAIVCHWCLSIWTGLALAWALNPVNIHGYILNILALSSASVLIDGLTDRLGGE